MHAPSSLSQWPDLPPDVLREISGRLRDPADFVRFHAICKPWRDTTTRTTKQSSPPWLLAPDKMNPLSIFLNLRCMLSRRSYWAQPPLSVRGRNWVASADGTAVWYFAECPSPSLQDPLTGAVTLLLPPFPHKNGRWEASPGGGVYRDGTVLLYSISDHGGATKFTAALLRPGDATWTVVEKTFRSPELVDIYVVYHRGKILITVDDPVLTPDDMVGVDDPVLTPDDMVGVRDVLAVSRPWMPCELDDNFYRNNYVLESRGELLCVSIYVSLDYPEAFGGKASVAGLVRALSVSVHVLEEDEAAAEKIRWVRKDGRSLADRVLFLGWPNSFAVDASCLSGGDAASGGCAYFVYDDDHVMPNQPCLVFSYNLIEDKAKFVERLPKGWNTDMCMWLFPQPYIAPTEEIIDRLESRKWWKKKKPHVAPTPRTNIYIHRTQPKCYNTYFRVSVRNLPSKVDSSQLRHFFSKHGKVSNAKVVCKRKNRMSKKIGLVTIAMVEQQTEALAALNRLVFNGCTLEVTLARSWKGRRVTSDVSTHRSDGYLICIVLFIFLFVFTMW